MKRKLIDLANQRTAALQEAENALNANDQAGYDSAMERVNNLNGEISRVNDLIQEQQRQIDMRQPTGGELRDMAEERGNALMTGNEVKFTVDEVRRAIYNQTTVATGTLVQPTGAGAEIRDPVGSQPSSIVDMVYVQDLTGMGAFMEPYVIEELTANGGKPETLAGTARAASDPTFGVAEIKPYELNVTSFVDRNISRLTPANYYAKIHAMAMRALRRKLAGLIVNGDGEDSPVFYGIKNAKNKAGAAIFASEALSGIDENVLDQLYFAYGSDESVGGNCRLLLTKPNLKLLGQLRGANEKRRLFTITPDAGNANTGVIADGGVVIPYALVSDAGDSSLLYGDLMNFEVGLFGEYSIRVDESVKAVERMTAILGDVFVGGNLIRHKGFVVGTVAEG